MTEPSDAKSRPIASFGRRKGRPLRTHHSELVGEMLPRVGVDLAKLVSGPEHMFERRIEDVWLEIGFGGGEHLADDAARNRDIGFIGCEPFMNGVAKLLAAIESAALDNVRVHAGDARELIGKLPAACLGRVNLLYPDPWPKVRQRKRRIVSDETLDALARAMKPGAELRFATDIDDYSAWTLSRILRNRYFRWDMQAYGGWLSAWPHWHSTRYEAKALREGRKPVYLTFIRNDIRSGETPDR